MIKSILIITAFKCSVFVSAQAATVNTGEPDSLKTTSKEVAETQSDFMNVFVAPEKELIVIQLKNLNTQDLEITLLDTMDKELKRTYLYQASTIAFFETQTLYSGDYVIKISDGISSIRKKFTLNK